MPKLMIDIDETDAKIIHALLQDSRARMKDIAKECGMSAVAVKKRVERLKKKKVIVKPVLISNLGNFGYDFLALVGINLESNQEQKIIGLMKEHVTVGGINTTIGKYDLCMTVFVKTLNELESLKNVIMTQGGVESIEINIWNKLEICYKNIDL